MMHPEYKTFAILDGDDLKRYHVPEHDPVDTVLRITTVYNEHNSQSECFILSPKEKTELRNLLD